MTRLNKWIQSYPRTLVIFYAPWSAKCLKHKTDLVDAYQRVHKKVCMYEVFLLHVKVLRKRVSYHYDRKEMQV